MFRFLKLLAGSAFRLLYSREQLLLENLALRQQIAALKRRNPKPRLTRLDASGPEQGNAAVPDCRMPTRF
jgi:hypothetical protein